MSSKLSYCRMYLGFFKPFKLHLLEEGPSVAVTCTNKLAIQLYRQMELIRRIEISANALYREKLIRGFCHLYSGQEACAVGIESALSRSDNVIGGYRIHSWSYTRGIDIIAIMCELLGRKRGCGRGKGGSMHMYTNNFYGGQGIVGAQVPIGAGLALAQKYAGTKDLTIAVYGDGAANQGQICETFNMAKLWGLPIIFVCENNGYGMGTSVQRSSASVNYYRKSDVVPGIWINGMDVLAVREGATFAINYVRNGKGPIILETATYRYHGHSMSDPGTSYRKREEIQKVRETRDPITRFGEQITKANLASAEDLKKIRQEARQEVDRAVEIAIKDGEIPLDEMFADIYSQPINPDIRAITPFEKGTHQRISKPINL